MSVAYVSAVIDADVDTIWSVLGDFHGIPAWIGRIRSNEPEHGLGAGEVGSVRRLTLEPDGLAAHASVAEVAIIGIPDAQWGEVGCAVVVPAAGAEVTLTDLVEHCTGRLARYKQPKSVITVDTLPRNALGKVQKDRLRSLIP